MYPVHVLIFPRNLSVNNFKPCVPCEINRRDKQEASTLMTKSHCRFFLKIPAFLKCCYFGDCVSLVVSANKIYLLNRVCVDCSAEAFSVEERNISIVNFE